MLRRDIVECSTEQTRRSQIADVKYTINKKMKAKMEWKNVRMVSGLMANLSE